MRVAVKIKGHKKESSKDKMTNFLNPSKVYIPLISQNDTNITLLVKKGDKVKIGTIIGKRKGSLRIPILSSVSGEVTGFSEKYTIHGELVKCVIIENDFKDTLEHYKKYKQMTDVTKEEFIDIIRNMGIIGMGGSGFPTYVKYDTDQEIDKLLINMVECEPYITADHMLVKERCEDILEVIDAMLEINKINEAIIVVKQSNLELVELLKNYAGSYLKIKVKTVKNAYPNGWERLIVKDVLNKEYKKIPLEIGVIVSNVSTIYAIYQALKNGMPLVKRVVTFSGSGIKKPANIEVLSGTLVSEIVNIIGGYNNPDNKNLVMGGPMMGEAIPTDDAVVTIDSNAVLVLDDKVCEITDCIKCGKCIEVCPANLMPVVIMKSIKNKQKLKDFNPDSCCGCGLCSYICPAGIKLREVVLNAKKIVEDKDGIQD